MPGSGDLSNIGAVAGVLVVNITWRGKTYVGTLLDCARHTNQWSAPRYHINLAFSG